MKTIARISTAAFLAGATTLSVTLPMPAVAKAGLQPVRVADLPIRLDGTRREDES